MTSREITTTAFERIELPLASDFTISRGTTETIVTTVVHIEDGEGNTGIGAAVPAAYYDETPDSVESVLPELLDVVETVGDPARTQEIEEELFERAPDEATARAAVSVALYDLVATQAEEPLFRRFGLSPERVPPTSYTISIDSPAVMASHAQRALQAGHSILKVKLGTDDDRTRIAAIRKTAPQARIRVDANGDWTAEEAIEKADWLANAGIELIEQPVPGDDIDALRKVADESFLPVAADESCVTAEDVPAIADAADIVVVKLMKCGGIRPALRQIETARAHGLDVMIGCMVESNASLAGSCHLAPLADYADLDGSLLLADDHYDGVPVENGQFDLSAVEAGTGARVAGEEESGE